MSKLEALHDAAHKSERSASRRLAAREGISPEQALHQTLTAAAGAQGLAHLLAERAQLAEAGQARADARMARKDAARSRHLARHDGPATAWRGWFDGSAKPNPGRCGIGALLCGPDGITIEISQDAGYGNSSEAEYRALIALLRAAVKAGATQLTLYGDSQVIIGDINGADSAAAPALSALRADALALMAQLEHVSLRWIPRHKNQRADALSQLATAQADVQLAAHATLSLR